MEALVNGIRQEVNIVDYPFLASVQNGLNVRRKNIGKQFGDFQIISCDYDFGLMCQVNIVRCVNCGFEKDVHDISAFKRGKGSAMLCKCRYKKKRKEPLWEQYSSYVGSVIAGFEALKYEPQKGFRIRRVQCGNEKWVSGVQFLGSNVKCLHVHVNHYNDPKWIGARAGHLTSIEKVGCMFRFKCDCGNEVFRRPTDVFHSGRMLSCGSENCLYHSALIRDGAKRWKTGIEFERKCVSIMQGQGIETELTPESGDYGVDFISKVCSYSVAFQCKKQKVKTGVDAVQEVYAGGRYYGCTRFVVVSPSGFTPQAEQMSRVLGVQLEKNLHDFSLTPCEENLQPIFNASKYNLHCINWTINGITKSQHEWCRDYGLSPTTVHNRLSSGMSLVEALSTPKHGRAINLTIDGITKSKVEWCEEYGISVQLFNYRVKYGGMSEREALSTPPRNSGKRGKEKAG